MYHRRQRTIAIFFFFFYVLCVISGPTVEPTWQSWIHSVKRDRVPTFTKARKKRRFTCINTNAWLAQSLQKKLENKRTQRACDITFCCRCHNTACSVHSKIVFSWSLISYIFYIAPLNRMKQTGSCFMFTQVRRCFSSVSYINDCCLIGLYFIFYRPIIIDICVFKTNVLKLCFDCYPFTSFKTKKSACLKGYQGFAFFNFANPQSGACNGGCFSVEV